MWTIALIVRSGAPKARLSPFFAKASGVMLVEPDSDDTRYIANDDGTSEGMCREILGHRVQRVVVGYIDAPAAHRLTKAGLDVRLGPCSLPVEDLIARFDELPRAVETSACPRRAAPDAADAKGGKFRAEP